MTPPFARPRRPAVALPFLRTRRRRGRVALVALAVGFACTAEREPAPLPPDVVARAGDATLTVEQAAQLLAASPSAAAESVTVHVIADLWVDHALLIAAVAEDTSLARLDVAALAEPALEQRLAHRLRETAVRPDTYVTADRLAELWREAGTGPEARLQHVLLRWPAAADSAARGRVRARAAAIRDSARAGVDLAGLARRHSEDARTASAGGDLGFRGRGRYPAPAFGPAIADLPEGGIADLVESADGVHVVRVVAWRYPPTDPDSDFLKLWLQRQRIAAEDAYLDSLVRAVRLERRDDRVANARAAVAGDARAGEAVLATFDGGEVTGRDVRAFVARQSPETQDAFSRATDGQVEGAIEQVVWKALLLHEADRRGVTLSAAERDSVLRAVRADVRALALGAGAFRTVAAGGGAPSGEEAGARAQALLRASLHGDTAIAPLGALGAHLRARRPASLNPSAFPAAARRAAALRDSLAAAPR